MNKVNLNVYLLIDNALLQEVSVSYTETSPQSRPEWLMPIYTERALEVSPLLIDLEGAYEAGDLDRVMGYVNALAPALHVSIIETGQSLAQIALHLRRFIFILDPDGRQFTLRFADCAILTPLSCVLSEAQWATMRGPIVQWSAHDRSGRLIELRPGPVLATDMTPLRLNRGQIAELDEVSEPDHCIAKVKMMRHGAPLPGTCAEQHAWAKAARDAWRVSGNSNSLFLLFFTEAVLVSEGKFLHIAEHQNYLLIDDVDVLLSKQEELINDERKDKIGSTSVSISK
jgi:hypothetical protein